MKYMTVRNLQYATEGKLFNCDEILDKEISAVVSDSRKIVKDCLFLCIKGAKVDGHDFAAQVIDDGAMLVLSEKEFPDETFPYLLVDSVFQATKDLAEFYRKGLDVKVVGITGSVGKTSTKEIIAEVLSSEFRVHKTKGNLNNEWGVPFTIFEIKDTDEIAVIEMGINHFGEMEKLAKMARPDIAVITNIGTSHIEFLESRDGIMKAKTAMFDFMPSNGIAVLNGDDDKLATILKVNGIRPNFYGFTRGCDVCAENFRDKGLNGTSFSMAIHENDGKMLMNVNLPLPGKKMVYNALAAATIAIKLGISPQKIKASMEKMTSIAGRNNIIRTDKYTIIDDSYNASPSAMEGSIDVLATAEGRKVAILGDMFELGEESDQSHLEVGEYAAEKGIDLIICVGENSKNMYKGALPISKGQVEYFKTLDILMERLDALLEDGDTILVKASHSMGFEKVVDKLKETV